MRTVLFLFKKKQLASSRVRVLNLLPELLKHGINATAEPWPRSPTGRLRLLSRLAAYDSVVLQKKLLHPVDVLLLRTFARHLVFDFDDAIYIPSDRVNNQVCSKRYARFRRIAKNADLVIAGNPKLAEEARRYAKRVATLPSAVETIGIPTCNNTHNEPYVIGWVGNGHNLHHLLVIGEVFQKLAQEFPLELRVVSNRSLHLAGVNVINIPWTLSGQASEIAKFDVGVMPLPQNSWTEGKCSYKALQYMAAAVPVVATNWGYNRIAIQDNETGLLADDNDQFYAKLKLLFMSPLLAQKIGRAGRLQVGREFSIEVIGEKLAKLLLA